MCGQIAAESSERIDNQLKAQGVRYAVRKTERAVREHRRRRRLEAQRVDEQAPVGEAQARGRGEDAQSVDVSSREIERRAPLEIRKRITAECNIIPAGERRRPHSAREPRRIEQLVDGQGSELPCPTDAIGRWVDVDPSVEAERPRRSLQARRELQVGDRAACLERAAHDTGDRQFRIRPGKHA